MTFFVLLLASGWWGFVPRIINQILNTKMEMPFMSWTPPVICRVVPLFILHSLLLSPNLSKHREGETWNQWFNKFVCSCFFSKTHIYNENVPLRHFLLESRWSTQFYVQTYEYIKNIIITFPDIFKGSLNNYN